MLTRTLTRMAAALPSSFKYKLAPLRAVYTKVLGLGQPVAGVDTPAGSFRWTIDELTSQAYLRAAYEPAMQQLLVRFLRPGHVVYDIGAHAGFHSLYSALLVRPGGLVVAFEPNPKSRASLERRVRANPELKIRIMPCALSDGFAVLRMDISRGSQSCISESAQSVVEARTLDSLVEESRVPVPNLIKIDVEGYEEYVLRGALRTLRSFSPVVLCDYNDSGTFDMANRMLRPIGYQVFPGPPVYAMRS